MKLMPMTMIEWLLCLASVRTLNVCPLIVSAALHSDCLNDKLISPNYPHKPTFSNIRSSRGSNDPGFLDCVLRAWFWNKTNILRSSPLV